MSPLAHPGDTFEQSWCRERTEEEDRAVHMCQAIRALVDAGAREIRLDPVDQFMID